MSHIDRVEPQTTEISDVERVWEYWQCVHSKEVLRNRGDIPSDNISLNIANDFTIFYLYFIIFLYEK